MPGETNHGQKEIQTFCHTILELSEKSQTDIILFDADIEKPQDDTFIYNFTKTCLETENEQKTKTGQNDEKNTS